MRDRTPFKKIEEDKAVRAIVEGTSADIGEKFFISLVENLSKVLNTYGAWVTEYDQNEGRLHALAFILGNRWFNNFQYAITGTPCERVVLEKRLIRVPERLLELYKGNPDLKDLNLQALGETGAVSYMGVPLKDVNGEILGHLSVLDTEPIPAERQVINIFRIFANRASAEMQRLRAEKEVAEREEKLRRLFVSAMDAIIEVDKDFYVTQINPAAERILGYSDGQIKGKKLSDFMVEEDRAKLTLLSRSLGSFPEGNKYVWIPRGLKIASAGGEKFSTEATLSLSVMHGETYYTLIFRDISEKIKAQEKINSLSSETEYLKEEIKSIQNFDEIIGESNSLKKVLNEIKQVSITDSTVLIMGETGTGKELIARAIHAGSKRSQKSLIKVNCAAIPASLIESEFFGHEKGAFTGATSKREGRFKIADGGTIFLDEVGELPLELQSKLLRVLQEGEFEPVGSSSTIKVNARVLAATNRNLKIAVEDGKFREDLYYRLNVFPIELPPLRDRSDDIEKLARVFVERFSKRTGITLEPLSEKDILRLKSYHWPGNIRELQNVIERAVITSTNGRLNLDKALPEEGSSNREITKSLSDDESIILSNKELQELERKNIIRALKKCGWKIAGKKGAAALLGLPTSTLNSKIKAFGIKRHPKG